MKSIRHLISVLLAGVPLLHAAEPGKTQQFASSDKAPDGLAKSDWQSIRAAYEAGRHAFQPVEGGWQARNPGQQWITKFDGRGFLAGPRDGEWQWGLELQSYGFGNGQRLIEGKAAVQAAGTRLTYQWDAAVHEWFVNDGRGLEHGFTVQERPAVSAADAEAPLSLTLSTRGTLHPCVSSDAQGVLFQNAAGATVINYGGLKVWDADGRELISRFAPAANGVRILVEEHGARYPLTIDPVAQQAYLKPTFPDGAQAGDQFGMSVAVSGDTVVIGAPFEDSSSTGVNSIRDESAVNSGAAFVFVRTGGSWSQQAYLKPASVGTTQAGDFFGMSVAISGETLVVGANGEDSSTTGVNSSANENSFSSGAAYVFVRNAGVWAQQAYLKPAAVGTTQAGDEFGASVAISGDTVIVGATGEDSNTTGVNSTPNESAAAAGAACVFARSAGVWTQQAYLKTSNVGTTLAGDNFGASVAVSGDTLVVGAGGEDSSTTGVNGTPNDDASNAGAAYVFTRAAGVWTFQAYLKPAAVGTTQEGDHFGTSVAIADDTVVVGAPIEDSATTGVNSAPNESTFDSGAVYVFTRTAGAWTQQAYLKPGTVGTTQQNDFFGGSVAVSGDTVIVGAPGEDSNTLGVNGTPDELAVNAGAAFVFVRSGTTWTQQAYLKPAAVGATQAADQFGNAVAVSGDTVVIGAPSEDSSMPGVNGFPNEGAADAGAACVFERNGTTWTQQAYLKPAGIGTNTTQAGDEFGTSIAISGDTVVVGAPREDSSSTGVNGTPDESAPNAGAAYVFIRTGTGWIQQAYLKPVAVGTSQAGDNFGISVAVSGDTVVVGARFEDSSTTGVNSTPNEGATDAGAAYVFLRSAGLWTQQAYLKPTAVGTIQAGDNAGTSVAIAGDTVIVGAPFEDSSTTGVNSTPNENVVDSGAAFVFTRSSGVWTQQAYLKSASVGTTQDRDKFGSAVAISGDTVVVGVPFEDSSRTAVNSTPNENAENAGAACVFLRSAGVWTQQAYLKPAAVGATQTGDFFGSSVAVAGDTVVVGAEGEDSSSTGVNSTPNEDGNINFNAGAAYVFTRSAAVWTQQAYLKPAAIGITQQNDLFGNSVAVADNTVVVGAPFEGSSTTGVNSTPNENAANAGAAYVFRRSGTTWTQHAYLKPAATGTTQQNDFFGNSVAVAGEIVVIGAPFEDSSTNGVNTTPNESAADAGAACIIAVPRSTVQLSEGPDLIAGVSSIGCGAAPQGLSATAKTFRIGNSGPGALAIASVSTLGGNAGDFGVNTTGMLSSVPAGGITTFAVTFTPAAAGSRTTTLRIVSDDLLDGIFDIGLTGLGLSFTTDTDGDGLNDASESQLAALGFDFQVRQPALVTTLFSNTAGLQPNLNAAGFFTPAQVQTLHIDVPLIQRAPGSGLFTFTFGLQKSTTLTPGSFAPFPFTPAGTSVNAAGRVEFQFTSPDNAAFFRLEPPP